MKTIKNKIKDAYAFEEGKTYMISIDTDNLISINAIRKELERTAPKIKWIVVSEVIKPIPNIESQNILEETLKNIIDEIENYTNWSNYEDIDNIKQIIQKHSQARQQSGRRLDNKKGVCSHPSPDTLNKKEEKQDEKDERRNI